MNVVCPECGALCDGKQCRRCDLPLELMSLVSRAADGLANSAARSLADDRPQRACMLAEESLRLRTRDNDLAAFVAIVTRCAGAAGSLASIPRPRADRLPDSLRRYLPGVIAAIRGRETESPPVIAEPQEEEGPSPPRHPCARVRCRSARLDVGIHRFLGQWPRRSDHSATGFCTSAGFRLQRRLQTAPWQNSMLRPTMVG